MHRGSERRLDDEPRGWPAKPQPRALAPHDPLASQGCRHVAHAALNYTLRKDICVRACMYVCMGFVLLLEKGIVAVSRGV